MWDGKFRKLKADEIECRVAMCRANGLSLLLYKDARCDQRILDETFGPFNWKNHYTRDNANCTIEIWDSEKDQWIGKENTGTESNTEKEKGLASDSFKRAAFNWGIGRELYTAPFIWIGTDKANIQANKCRDHFSVVKIDYENDKISELQLVNDNLNMLVFDWKLATGPKNIGSPKTQTTETKKPRVSRKSR